MTKAMFDCRCDNAALYHQYQVSRLNLLLAIIRLSKHPGKSSGDD